MAKPSLVVLIGILAAGIFLRVWPSAGFHQVGYDEGIYNRYVQILLKHGVSSYPDLAQGYLKWQEERADAIVPATRIGFILPAAILAELTGVGFVSRSALAFNDRGHLAVAGGALDGSPDGLER